MPDKQMKELANHYLNQQLEAFGALEVAKDLLLAGFDEAFLVEELEFGIDVIADARKLIKEIR